MRLCRKHRYTLRHPEVLDGVGRTDVPPDSVLCKDCKVVEKCRFEESREETKNIEPLRKIDSHIFDDNGNLIANLEFYEVFN